MIRLIRSAALRLTVYYLTIAMILSIGFSFWIYNLSTNALEESLRRPPSYIQLLGKNSRTIYTAFREARLAQSSKKLRNNLVLFNTAVFVLSGVVCYLLARRTLEPIEEAMEAQGRFTADASHELRTPLTAMQSEIEVALRDPKLSKNEAKQLLASNLEEVGKLKRLSEGLLKLAHSKGNPLILTSVPLDYVVTSAKSQLRTTLKTKRIKIIENLVPVQVQADKEALGEVITILFDNAVKYSPRDTTITLTVRKHGHYAYLSITDEGAGINPADLPHIFERFYRADNARTKEGQSGYGLGLAIAQHVMHLHHGSIEAKSAGGKGATFVVKIPLAGS